MKQRLFGTNGVRGIANVDLTSEIALALAKSYGSLLELSSTVAIGRDTRLSGEMFKHAVISGLLSAGCSVVDTGIVPIPALQYYVRDNADGGIMITASHNPWEYNGIKIIDRDGTEISKELEGKIEGLYYSSNFRNIEWNKIGELRNAEIIQNYINGILKLVDREKIARSKLRVAIDLGNGAGCMATPRLLRELGVEVIALNADPEPVSPGREPEPTKASLKELMELVVSAKASFGAAHDGDADRAVFIDEKGEYVEDDVTLAIFVKNALSKKTGPVVTPVSSSQSIVDIANEFGVKVEWTKVGSIHVARKMKAINAAIGGEGNGGIIFPEHQYCRDGAMAVARMCELVAEQKLSELANQVPKYYNLKTKLRCENKEAVMQHVKSKLKGEIIAIDGFKAYYDDGWLLIRPSGTEPIIRIFAESKSMDRARELLEYGCSLIKNCS
ncbi:MAG: phosphoglucosamine mutase [Methanocellales archaeon]